MWFDIASNSISPHIIAFKTRFHAITFKFPIQFKSRLIKSNIIHVECALLSDDEIMDFATNKQRKSMSLFCRCSNDFHTFDRWFCHFVYWEMPLNSGEPCNCNYCLWNSCIHTQNVIWAVEISLLSLIKWYLKLVFSTLDIRRFRLHRHNSKG